MSAFSRHQLAQNFPSPSPEMIHAAPAFFCLSQSDLKVMWMTKNLRPPSFWLVLNQTGFQCRTNTPLGTGKQQWERGQSKAESLCTVALLVFTPGSVQEVIAQVLLWDRLVHLGSGWEHKGGKRREDSCTIMQQTHNYIYQSPGLGCTYQPLASPSCPYMKNQLTSPSFPSTETG